MVKLIETWEELDGLESENYKIEVDHQFYCGWVKPKIETEATKEAYFEHHLYLSTHTFYEKSHKAYTAMLQKLGFDVELKSWG